MYRIRAARGYRTRPSRLGTLAPGGSPVGPFESEILVALRIEQRLQQAELRRMTRVVSGSHDLPALTLAVIGSTLIMAGSALRAFAQRRRIVGTRSLSADLCHGCPD